ncbi:MAG: DUF3467 domain-containing protein [Deltaproteobacteria bacterium]|nr:MAG: DUF3467 domain-containing protein [Deltaproteobacteria bacterium]
MNTKEKTLSEEEKASDEEAKSVLIDLGEIYRSDPKDIVPDISVVHYSNLAFIQVTHRDVYIDFLQMPGIKKDDKVLLDGTRIYMSHVAAKKLVEALEGILEQVYSRGDMEMYVSAEKDE